MIQYHVEGLSCQQLKSSSTSTNAFTLSFYAKSNASRAIASEIRFAEGTNLHASKLHTIGTSWARYTMTIPAASSTEVDNDNTAAFQINLFLHAGSNTSSGTIAGTTLTSLTQANRAAGIGSIVASTDNTLEITGVQLEVGSQATPFEHRSYGEERQLCYRYYYRTPDSVAGGQAANEAFPCVGNMDGSQTGAFMFLFPVPMRAAPTAIEQSGTAGDYSIRVTSDANGTSVPSASGFTSEKALVNLVSSGAGFTGGDGAFMRMEDTDAFIAFSAELQERLVKTYKVDYTLEDGTQMYGKVDDDDKIRLHATDKHPEFQDWLRANKDSLPSDIQSKVDDGTLTIEDADQRYFPFYKY